MKLFKLILTILAFLMLVIAPATIQFLIQKNGWENAPTWPVLIAIGFGIGSFFYNCLAFRVAKDSFEGREATESETHNKTIPNLKVAAILAGVVLAISIFSALS